eukprot:scaffold19621_cov63-Cyclotella_meneghiniana.AAC.6
MNGCPESEGLELGGVKTARGPVLGSWYGEGSRKGGEVGSVVGVSFAKEIGELIKQTRSLVTNDIRIPIEEPDIEVPDYMRDMMELSKFG